MKANELMIGNYVLSSNVITTVFHLDKDDDDRFRINYVGEQIFDPIPLTEEWLLKMGFKNKHTKNAEFYLIDLIKIGSYPALKKLCLYSASADEEWNVFFLDYYTGSEKSEMFPNNIKYVHQLQNLYFALTGEEL